MTNSTDFAGLDFCTAMGEVYGYRTWRVDTYGRLRALHVPQAKPWRPGVNTAACHKSDYAMGGFIAAALNYRFTTYTDPSSGAAMVKATTPPDPEPETPKPPHIIPEDNCQCGFYAYTDLKHEEASEYHGDGFVTGIVKGTGRTLIGTRGFRCEKAEIVALLDPVRGGKKKAEWRGQQRDALARVYPDVPLLPSRAALVQFAPVEPTLPDPSSDEFWSLP